MLTYVSKFLSGGLNPFWPHVSLLSISVLASIAVGAGIIFERPKYSAAVHRVAFWLIVAGVAIEAICTIFLFVFDEGISQAQQGRIEALLDELTPAQLEYGKFTSDLGGIAPVPIVIEAEPDSNSQFFAADLNAAFRQAEWPQRSIINEDMSFIPGILVKYLYPPTNDNPHKTAAAICRALNEQLLTKARVLSAMTLEALHEWQRKNGVPEAFWLVQHPENKPSAQDWPDTAPAGAVVIHVGSNRNNFFFNNARTKKGLKFLPDMPVLESPCGRQ